MAAKEQRNRHDHAGGGGNILGASGEGNDARRRQQQEYAAALDQQKSERERRERESRERRMSSAGNASSGGDDVGEIRRRQQQEYAAALEQQIAAKDQREREDRRSVGGDIFGGGRGDCKDARRLQQQEYAADLEQQMAEKQLHQGALLKRQWGGPDGGIAINGSGSGRGGELRKKQQEEYAFALEQQKNERALRERASRSRHDEHGLGASPPGIFDSANDGRADKQRAYANELQQQMQLERQRKELRSSNARQEEKRAFKADRFGLPTPGPLSNDTGVRRASITNMASPEEIEERQRKQQHFQNALAEQVAQKEAAKAEKKRAQLEEERREEAKLEREREQLKAQFDAEQAERQRKENAKGKTSADSLSLTQKCRHQEEREKREAQNGKRQQVIRVDENPQDERTLPRHGSVVRSTKQEPPTVDNQTREQLEQLLRQQEASVQTQRDHAEQMDFLRRENEELRSRMSEQIAAIQKTQLEEKQARQWQEQKQREIEGRRTDGRSRGDTPLSDGVLCTPYLDSTGEPIAPPLSGKQRNMLPLPPAGEPASRPAAHRLDAAHPPGRSSQQSLQHVSQQPAATPSAQLAPPRRISDALDMSASSGGDSLRASLRGDSELVYPPAEDLRRSFEQGGGCAHSRRPSMSCRGGLGSLHAVPEADELARSQGLRRPASERASRPGSSGSRRRPTSSPGGGDAVHPPPPAAMDHGDAERESTPGLDTLVRRAEERLRELQLAEIVHPEQLSGSDTPREEPVSLPPPPPMANMKAYHQLEASLAAETSHVAVGAERTSDEGCRHLAGQVLARTDDKSSLSRPADRASNHSDKRYGSTPVWLQTSDDISKRPMSTDVAVGTAASMNGLAVAAEAHLRRLQKFEECMQLEGDDGTQPVAATSTKPAAPQGAGRPCTPESRSDASSTARLSKGVEQRMARLRQFERHLNAGRGASLHHTPGCLNHEDSIGDELVDETSLVESIQSSISPDPRRETISSHYEDDSDRGSPYNEPPESPWLDEFADISEQRLEKLKQAEQALSNEQEQLDSELHHFLGMHDDN
ncbi:MAG: hypothetical protein SGPRY_008279 [Prymnesium sp.]